MIDPDRLALGDEHLARTERLERQLAREVLAHREVEPLAEGAHREPAARLHAIRDGAQVVLYPGARPESRRDGVVVPRCDERLLRGTKQPQGDARHERAAASQDGVPLEAHRGRLDHRRSDVDLPVDHEREREVRDLLLERDRVHGGRLRERLARIVRQIAERLDGGQVQQRRAGVRSRRRG